MSPQDQKTGYQRILTMNKPYRLVRLAKDPCTGLVTTLDWRFRTLDEAREAAKKDMGQDSRCNIGFSLYFIVYTPIEEIMAVDPVSVLPTVTQVWKDGV